MTIKDSGARHKYSTGAVRDVQVGKGRCDLLPLDVISEWAGFDDILLYIWRFTETIDNEYLYNALWALSDIKAIPILVLRLSLHFEEGARKYGERNWEKGIPLSSYIDSAVRHYLKHIAGCDDEDHFIAFIWNIVCAIWTNEHLPEMRDLPYGKSI